MSDYSLFENRVWVFGVCFNLSTNVGDVYIKNDSLLIIRLLR